MCATIVTMRAIIAGPGVWFVMVGALFLRVAVAQDGPAAPSPAKPVQINYVLGKTKLSEAVAYWRASGAKVLGAGHLALGTGSGVDGLSKTSADKVVLVDVAGIDFEGITSARFGFFEEKLYVIQATLTPGLRNSKSDLNYNKEQLASLEKSLRQKYGPPEKQLRSLYAKSAPDVLIWNVDGNSLRFVSNGMNTGLSLMNEKTEASIREYRKEICKTVNTKDHITCW